MTTHHRFAFPFLAALLTGCAFSGGPVGSPPLLKRPSDAGTLIIYRNNSWVGIFGTMHVSIDDKPVYRLGVGQRYSIKLDPGHYFLNYSIGLNDCGGAIEIDPRQTLEVRLVADCMMIRKNLSRPTTL